jgi:hypothetical protein
MDVSNLTPTPNGSAATGTAATRARTDRAPFEAAAVHAPAPAAPVTSRPVLGSSHVADRIERSTELQRTLAELKSELGRTSEAPRDQIDALRRQVAGGTLASHGSFEAAALGLLHGVSFFAA